MAEPLSINDIIVQLDRIIDECILKSSRMGYFACLYRKMTLAVKQGIETRMFEDNERMEVFDVQFAGRYIQAYQQYGNRQACTSAWCHAFDAGGQAYTVLQHLLLGMNAHINLDLGIAAAQISAGKDIQTLRHDFEKINDVIGSLVNSVQTDLESICFPMHLVRYIDNSSKDAVINFSIALARKTAWTNALALSALPSENHEAYINTLDIRIAQVARNIVNPNFSQNLLLKSIRFFEPRDVGKIISLLRD